jgi:hypothetical protein
MVDVAGEHERLASARGVVEVGAHDEGVAAAVVEPAQHGGRHVAGSDLRELVGSEIDPDAGLKDVRRA